MRSFAGEGVSKASFEAERPAYGEKHEVEPRK
jgi:hypothetical protein